MEIALVIFAKNERRNSEKIFPRIPFTLFYKTYLVDGNSIDGTIEFYKKKGIRVFNQKYPGVGGAYESAFRNTKEDALVFFHPDGNSDPKALHKIVNLLREGKEFIVPSRMIKGSFNEEDQQLLKPRKWFCQLLGFLANITFGTKNNFCSDITQGYRALSRKAYSRLDIKIPNAVAPDFEQVIRALKKNIKIHEFPTREGARVHGKTSMVSLQTGWENIQVFLQELIFKICK